MTIELKQPSATPVLWRVVKVDGNDPYVTAFVEARLYFDARRLAQAHFAAESVELAEFDEAPTGKPLIIRAA
jgi:hypothetical protein